MNNKKLLIIIISGIVLLVIVVLIFAIVVYRNQVKKAELEEQKQLILSQINLPITKCNYSNDSKAISAAVENKDVAICNCVENQGRKKSCQNTVMDLIYYNQAIQQYNTLLCGQVQDSSRKDSCRKMVKSEQENLEKKDPQKLALAYLNSHNIDEAIKLYEKMLQSQPSNVDYLVAASIAYAGKAFEEQEKGNDKSFWTETATNYIEKAKELRPRNAEVRRAEGYIFEAQSDPSAAIESYSKAIELDPNNALAYAGRGHVQRIQGKSNEALEDLNKAAELDSNKNLSLVYINLCGVYNEKNQFSEAIENCVIVLGTDGTTPFFKSEAHQILSRLYALRGDYAQANSHLLVAQTLTPQDPNLYVSFSKLYVVEGKHAEAEAMARKAIKMAPNNVLGHRMLAYSLYGQEKHKAAAAEASKALNLIEKDNSLTASSKQIARLDLYYVLADIYKEMGDRKNEKRYKEMGDNMVI